MAYQATGDAHRRRLTSPLSSRDSCSQHISLTLSHRLHEDYAAIVEAACNAWQRLIAGRPGYEQCLRADAAEVSNRGHADLSRWVGRDNRRGRARAFDPRSGRLACRQRWHTVPWPMRASSSNIRRTLLPRCHRQPPSDVQRAPLKAACAASSLSGDEASPFGARSPAGAPRGSRRRVIDDAEPRRDDLGQT